MVGSDGMEPARAGEPQIDQYGQRQSISGADGGVGNTDEAEGEQMKYYFFSLFPHP